MVLVGDVDAGCGGARVAELFAVPVPDRPGLVVGDGEMVPPVPARAGGVGEDIASEVLVVIVAPEVVAGAARTAQAEAVGGSTGALGAPEGDLASTPPAGGDGGGIDPGLDREGLIAARNIAGVGELHPVTGPVEAQDPGRSGGETQQEERDRQSAG